MSVDPFSSEVDCEFRINHLTLFEHDIIIQHWIHSAGYFDIKDTTAAFALFTVICTAVISVVELGEAVGETLGEALGEVVGEVVGEVLGEALGEVLGEALRTALRELCGTWI